MKISKKALALVLALTMVVSTFFSTAVFAVETPAWDSNFVDSNITYHITDSNGWQQDSGTVEVTTAESGKGDYSIPLRAVYREAGDFENHGFIVNAIKDSAFTEDTKASSITAEINFKNISVKSATLVGGKPSAEAVGGYVGLYKDSQADKYTALAFADTANHFVFDGWYDISGKD